MIVVVGSANVDIVIRVDRLPNPGETVVGRSVNRVPGGKGANQAAAAALMGARTAFYGAVGTDGGAAFIVSSLHAKGVDVSGVETVDGPSGTAFIEVDDHGENRIVVIAGANAHVGRPQLPHGTQAILTQLEIPLEATIGVLHAAQAQGVPWRIMNPSPAAELPDEAYQYANVLIVNEAEAKLLSGGMDGEQAAQALRRRGAETVVLTQGERGGLCVGATTRRFEADAVTAVDTTAAGDCFAGALAVALVEGKTLSQACQFAAHAAALAVTRFGAQESLPTRAEVDQAS